MTDMERFIHVAVEQFARDRTAPETNLYVRLREETYRVIKWPEIQVDAIESKQTQEIVVGAKFQRESRCCRLSEVPAARSTRWHSRGKFLPTARPEVN